ncbi:MAG: hypothetical protein K0S34_1922 [Bacillales bacterium]|nr:hypothetical protein [Bacillales bacterium]
MPIIKINNEKIEMAKPIYMDRFPTKRLKWQSQNIWIDFRLNTFKSPTLIAIFPLQIQKKAFLICLYVLQDHNFPYLDLHTLMDILFLRFQR